MSTPSAATTTSTGTSRFTNWEEVPGYAEGAPLPRLARAEVDFTYEGDLEGTGECRYLFRYGPDGACEILGFEHITGRLRGREGSFALRHEGTFGGTGLSVRSTVVPGSATGDLDGLSGSGTLEAPPGEESCTYHLTHTTP